LDNWTPRNSAEAQHLETARRFAMEVRRGFLVLIGPVGVGKSHLAVACMRVGRDDGLYVTQNMLLRRLRATYTDKRAIDPVGDCQEAGILVLDEMGLSSGGRDEAPMLHQILDYRYGRKKPTILTSNLPWDELLAQLGERLADRMRECAYGVLVFAGESHRADASARYFSESPISQDATRIKLLRDVIY
jgi:DNA replication protein DnaC